MKIKKIIKHLYKCYYCKEQILNSEDVGGYYIFKDKNIKPHPICDKKECWEKNKKGL